MANKNTAIVIGVIVTILILIGIILTILFMTGTVKFPTETIFRGASRVSCSKSGTDTWACSAIGLAGISLDEPTNIFRISEPSRGDEFRPLQLATALDISPDLNSFLNTHTIQSVDWTACKIGTYLPFDAGWDTRIGVTPFNFAGEEFAWCLGDVQLGEILGDGFIVVRGKTFEQNGDFVEDVTTYGLCRGRTCSLLPVEDNSVFGNPDFRASSMIIKWKENGYTLDDACSGFGLGCQDIVVYRFQNNECNLVEISELERLSNDFNTLSECQEQIDPIIEVYRLEENKCNLVQILESTRTSNDFDNLETCNENRDPIIKSTLVISIAIGIIALFIIGITIFFFIRRKR